MASKKKSNKIHARRRALERYGVNLGGKSLSQIIHDIRTGKAKFIKRFSNTRTKWLVDLPDNNKAMVIYCKTTGTLITVLPYNPESNNQ